MKKIQTLMLTLLVVVMGMAVQSCGKDDDNVTTLYTISASVDVKNQGSFKDSDIETLKKGFSKSETASYASDAAAKTAADQAIQIYKSQIEAAFSGIDWTNEEANIVITISVTNKKTQKVVSQWTVTIHKGVTIAQVK
ncbi:MAG: hypothetical protein J6O23_01330 [Prevotella sp.]|nr:hypothetical protein [Prevotella sp.]